MMRRREFITLIGGAAATWPLIAQAEQGERVRRIGVLLPAAAENPEYQPWVGAFLQELSQLGWSIGRNVRIDTRWAATNADIRKYAAEVVGLAPDVILAHGSNTVGQLLQATHTVPIVFPVIADPIAAGFVDSLARPGGNATGFMLFENSISGKWLELLKQIAPGVTRVAVIVDPTIPTGPAEFSVIQSMATPSLRVEVTPINKRDASEIERALAALARDSNGGLIVTPGLPSTHNRDLSSRLRRATSCLRFITNASSLLLAGLFPMALIGSRCTGARLATSTAFSKARSLQTSRYRHRRSISLSSTSRPPRHLASRCHKACSPAPMR